jgi:hypothetical protein
VTPVLISRNPRNEESGQSLHSERSVSLMQRLVKTKNKFKLSLLQPLHLYRYATMAGYFSNHSQSRFLANSTSGTSQSTTASSSPLSRTRPPSSKHFSTSVSTSGDERPHQKEKAAANGSANGVTGVHPLRNTYVRTLACVESVCSLIHVFATAAGSSGFVNNETQGIK